MYFLLLAGCSGVSSTLGSCKTSETSLLKTLMFCLNHYKLIPVGKECQGNGILRGKGQSDLCKALGAGHKMLMKLAETTIKNA